MAYAKKLPTPRQCQHCRDPYEAVDRRRLYCCPGCKTAASQARRPKATAKAQAQNSAALPAPAALDLAGPPAEPARTGPSFGKLVLATATGNLVSDALKNLWAPKSAASSAPASGWPVWPPAELLAATGPPVLLTDPSWPTAQMLTPVTYHGHQLYLCLEEGLTVVLRQVSAGRWQYVRTPAELAQLAAQRPLSPGIQQLIAQYAPLTAPLHAAARAPLTAPLVAGEYRLGTADSTEPAG
jgi:hypothetical protein